MPYKCHPLLRVAIKLLWIWLEKESFSSSVIVLHVPNPTQLTWTLKTILIYTRALQRWWLDWFTFQIGRHIYISNCMSPDQLHSMNWRMPDEELSHWKRMTHTLACSCLLVLCMFHIDIITRCLKSHSVSFEIKSGMP